MRRDRPRRPDRLIAFAAGALPLVNVGVWYAIRASGGAHGHGWIVVAGVVAVELAAIVAFCALRTDRPMVRSVVLALLADAVVSVLAIYVLIFVFLVVGYSSKGGGD